MTSTQLDEITDIMFNLPLEELGCAIHALTPEARLALEDQCRAMMWRMECIKEGCGF